MDLDQSLLRSTWRDRSPPRPTAFRRRWRGDRFDLTHSTKIQNSRPIQSTQEQGNKAFACQFQTSPGYRVASEESDWPLYSLVKSISSPPVRVEPAQTTVSRVFSRVSRSAFFP